MTWILKTVMQEVNNKESSLAVLELELQLNLFSIFYKAEVTNTSYEVCLGGFQHLQKTNG